MIESIVLTAVAVVAAYRGTLAAVRKAPAGTLRARLRAVMGGGGPGPAGE